MNATETMRKIEELDLEPIKSKLMHEASGEGWSAARADAIAKEYCRFLFMMHKFPDESFAPLVDVDTFWHYHILDTRKYAADCQEIFGYFLHHHPYVGLGDGEAQQAEHAAFGLRMHQLYQASFGEACPGAGNAWCAVSTATADTAWCAVTTAAAGAAWCAVATTKALTKGSAWCAAATPKGAANDTAWCALAAPGAAAIETAWCAAAKPKAVPNGTAWCAAAEPVAKSTETAWCAVTASTRGDTATAWCAAAGSARPTPAPAHTSAVIA